MILVDELRQWPTTIACFKPGSCHMTTDGGLDELHAFAKRLGLKASWFQDHGSVPHYDLTEARRAKAIMFGAVFIPAREQARKRVAARADAAKEKT